MRYKTEFNFQKAVIVNEKMLRDMVKEIQKYCVLVEFKSKLEKGDTVDFDSLDELIAFENTKMNSIKAIYITAWDEKYKNKISVDIESYSVFVTQFYNTISVEMTTDSTDKKAAFKAKMDEIFQRHEQGKRYNIISRNGFLNVLFAAYIIVLLIVAFTFVASGFKGIDQNLLNIWFVLSIIYLFKGPIGMLQKKYYPPIVFYLGDGISVYDDNAKARENFFWGGIVAVILSIIFLILEINLNK